MSFLIEFWLFVNFNPNDSKIRIRIRWSIFFQRYVVKNVKKCKSICFLVYFWSINCIISLVTIKDNHDGPQRWRSVLERRPRKRKVGYSNPIRDKPKSLIKKHSDSSNAYLSAICVSVMGPRRWYYKRMPHVTECVHAKEPSLLNGHECWAYVKIISPSPVIVMSPY